MAARKAGRLGRTVTGPFRLRAEIEKDTVFYSELIYLFSRSIFLMNFVQILISIQI
jgi:hypothetical protein